MFPIWDATGKIVAFGGRSLVAGQEPKYLNSPDTDLFHKGRLLYGAHLARPAWRNGEAPLLVEGYFDVLAFHAAGVSRAVASLGTALTEVQAQYLRRFHEVVDLCYDRDPAGQDATRRAYLILSAAGIKVNVLQLPAGKDPAELLESQGVDALRAVSGTARPYLEDVLDSVRARPELATPRGKAEIVHEVRAVWQAIPDAVEKMEYLDVIARTLRIQPKILSQGFGVTQGAEHTFGKNRHNMEVTPAPSRSLPSIEIRLLATVLERGEGLDRVVGQIPEWGQQPAVAAVLEAVAQGMRKNNLAIWVERLDESARGLALQANACAVPDGGVEAIDEYVRAIKYRRCQTRWDELKERIRQGDSSPDLLAEVQSVQQLLQRQKAAAWAPDRSRMGKEG